MATTVEDTFSNYCSEHLQTSLTCLLCSTRLDELLALLGGELLAELEQHLGQLRHRDEAVTLPVKHSAGVSLNFITGIY